MTEAEWLQCADPTPMLEFLRGKASDRKLRLFAVACCRLAWHHFSDERSKQAVVLAEQFADGKASAEDCKAVWEAGSSWPFYPPSWRAWEEMSEWGDFLPKFVAENTVEGLCYDSVTEALGNGPWSDLDLAEKFREEGRVKARQQQVSLLRDIVGNPLRSTNADSSWFTPRVVALAQAIYDDRGFDRLPVLADTLEEAGCDNADLLSHCRGPGPHVRGCWAVDLMLGKE